MSTLAVYQDLLSALGNPAYNQLMDVVDNSGKMQHDRVVETVELRFEKRLGDEMSGMRRDIAQLKDYLVNRMDIHADKLVARMDVQSDKVDAQFKWMVAMWLTQMIAMVGILAAILQLVIRIR